MTAQDLIALLPLLIIAASVVIVMLAVAFFRRHEAGMMLTLLGITAAALSLPMAWSAAPRQVTPLLMIDHYALFYIGLMLAGGLAVTALSYTYLEGRQGHRDEYHHGEFYLLLLLALQGALVLVASQHFASFLLGLELLSISLFALIAYPVNCEKPLEAGIKYMILSSLSSAFLLFGMALVYFRLGALSFPPIANALLASADLPEPLILAGIALILVGVGFKLSLVPFHLWAPDVYEGAPAPVGAFVATISKGAIFALLLRFVGEAGLVPYGSLFKALSLIAVLSMLAGNWLALLQNNLKRVLAYSSIAHLGYILVAFLAGGRFAAEAVSFYLVAYFVTTLGAFGVIAALSRPDRVRDLDTLAEFRGLFWERPALAGIMTIMLLSLAGIPLTAGFVGKFYVLDAGVSAALWLLVLVVIIGSAIGLFYYLRIILAMYLAPAESTPFRQSTRPAIVALPGDLVLLSLSLVVIWLGVYPGPLIELILSGIGP